MWPSSGWKADHLDPHLVTRLPALPYAATWANVGASVPNPCGDTPEAVADWRVRGSDQVSTLSCLFLSPPGRLRSGLARVTGSRPAITSSIYDAGPPRSGAVSRLM
jgi:hypothetical protein